MRSKSCLVDIFESYVGIKLQNYVGITLIKLSHSFIIKLLLIMYVRVH